MASLVEELVNILEAEQKVYEKLTGYEEKKKDVLIRADVPALEEKDRRKDDSYETHRTFGYPARDTEETDHCKR